MLVGIDAGNGIPAKDVLETTLELDRRVRLRLDPEAVIAARMDDAGLPGINTYAPETERLRGSTNCMRSI